MTDSSKTDPTAGGKKPAAKGKKLSLGSFKKPEPPKGAAGFEAAPDISKTGNYFTDGNYDSNCS